MPLTTQVQAVSVDRLTYRSTIPFEAAESRLRSSIQKDPRWSQFQDKPGSRPADRESFEAFITAQVGPHGFMYFNEYNHGAWLPLYDPPTIKAADANGGTKKLRAVRFILGNPLIAITMLRHDLDAGLSVPVELYLVEEANGTRVVWFRPSGLVAGYEGAGVELVEAAKALDAKLEKLVRWVLSESLESHA
ncbi:hypothetical protein PV08_02042 [Exophiala spinifera]|uniref:DUF302 domain-containing protein n=1 Tax=Exophiala spinifera TaxID=91928 RepID=A0A0D2A9N6_9EURO|nr:uncharacterized protein PV08_02042 [Exophiala spinifera]KIW21462.1 hypothetical protein PV08_02042 [Exophiala spinifera]